MASALFSASVASFKATPKPGNCLGYHYNKNHFRDDLCQSSAATQFGNIKAKAEKSDQRPKPNSVICADCDGNGAVLCSQCKGSGVNSVDLFNGQFKAGDSCWLCGGRKEMLCGNCNGAAFVGGFLSTFDE